MSSWPISRILFVIGTLEVGGTEKHLLMLATAMASKGVSVTVFCLAGRGPLATAFENAGVRLLGPVRKAGERKIWRRTIDLAGSAMLLFQIMQRLRPEAVHFFLPASYLVGAPLALLACCPVRIMSRRSLNAYQSSNALLAHGERWLHRVTTAILGNSKRVIRQLRDEEGVPERKLTLIYNGISMAAIPANARTSTREMLSICENSLVLTIVANLIPYKGHLDLLDALSIAREHLPDGWRLLVLGRDCGIGPKLKERTEQLGLSANVVFLGSQPNVPELLAASDIGLLCSHEEGFSNAILEGMAAGLPMIVTDAGGNAEAVVHCETGIVVPPRNHEKLAEAIVTLAGDSDLRRQFGVAGRRRVEQEFSAERCIEAYRAFYAKLLAQQTPGAA